jgi:hypothetical protein
MAYASVNSVYEIVKRVANKDNRGFIRPADFNAYARQAQLDVFHEILGEYKFAQVSRRRQLQFRDGNYNSIENIKDDLRPLVVYAKTLKYGYANSAFVLPDDYAYYITLEFDGSGIEVVAPEDINSYRNSFDGAPTESSAIASFINNGVLVFPDTIDYDVKLTYYKNPQGSTTTGSASVLAPSWAYNTIGGQPVYNSGSTINFELPKHLESRLAQRILSYIGIELREPELFQASEKQEADQKMARQ